MSESIVQKEPAVQSNPFAKHLPGHVNAGTIAVESERAIAEAQGKLVIAKRFPRDQARAYTAIIDACKRPGLAEEACYSFPRGGKAVSGPTIRLTEMLAANWGNVDYGLRELSRREGVSEMEAYCWDLETNTMSSQKFTVRHIRDKTGGNVALTDERDIYELTANMGARRLRSRILAIIPADLVQAAVDECGKTLQGNNEGPIADRIRAMVTAFKSLGVPNELIQKRLGHTLDSISGEELAELRKIHNSIRDSVSKIGDWFGGDSGQGGSGEQMPGDPQPERPAPPPRAAKGARAAKENATKAPEVIVSPEGQSHTEPVEPKPAEPVKQVEQEPSKPVEAPKPAVVPRASLNPGESITVPCEVVAVRSMEMKAGPDTKPSVRVELKGGYLGKEILHFGGGQYVLEGGEKIRVGGEGSNAQDWKTVPAAPWAVGAKLNVTLFGKKLQNGEVRTYIQDAQPIGAVQPVGGAQEEEA